MDQFKVVLLEQEYLKSTTKVAKLAIINRLYSIGMQRSVTAPMNSFIEDTLPYLKAARLIDKIYAENPTLNVTNTLLAHTYKIIKRHNGSIPV